MPILSHSRFLRYQGIFYRNVVNADMVIELGVTTAVQPTGDFLTDFTGSSNRDITWFKFPALYSTSINTAIREITGISETEQGQIFLSPLQLIPVLGYYKLDKLKVRIKKSEHLFLVEKITYLEPLYNSCIALQLDLRDAIKGF